MTIPAINHQLWISSNNANAPVPEDILKNIKSWHETHPDFTHFLWTVNDLENELENFYSLDLMNYVRQCRFPAMQSDLIRLALLYHYGGVWNDLKNYPLKPFLDGYLKYEHVVITEHWPTGNPDAPVPHIANGFLAAPKQDPFIWKCLINACVNIKLRVNKGVFGLTGGGVMTRLILQHTAEGTPLDYYLIPYTDIWNKTIERSGGSYNNNDKHWSMRQKVESPFID